MESLPSLPDQGATFARLIDLLQLTNQQNDRMMHQCPLSQIVRVMM
jgi:hypothetical protein